VNASGKIVFAVAYIVVALIAYCFFFDYSVRKWREEYAALEAEWVAKYPSLKGYGPEYFFFSSVWGRNVVWGGIALVFGGPIGALVLLRISRLLGKGRKS